MALNPPKILEYWRDSLHDAILMSPELKEHHEVDPKALLLGEIPLGIAGKLIASRTAKNDEPPKYVEVVVAPYMYMPDLRSNGRSAVPAVWIPALVDKQGRLSPNPEASPWIARELLEPSKEGELIIGDLSDYLEKFKATPLKSELWIDVVGVIERLFLTVSGAELAEWSPPEFRRVPGIIMPAPEDTSAKGKLLELCKRWLERDTLPALLQASIAPGIKTPKLMTTVPVPSSVAGHYGHMGAYGLNDEQRAVVRYAMNLIPGQALAVNGPPGTGKTSVLQGVIASLIVKRAVEGKKEAPVIVATSTNNQAVSNIIDTFTTEENPQGNIITKRWLRGVDSIAVRVPSGAAAQKEAGKYQNLDELRQRIFQINTLREQTQHFLDCYHEWYGGTGATLTEVIAKIQAALMQTVKTIDALEARLPVLSPHVATYPGCTLVEKEMGLKQQRAEQENLLHKENASLAAAKKKMAQFLAEDSKTPWYFLLLASLFPPFGQQLVQKLALHASRLEIDAIAIDSLPSSPLAVRQAVGLWYQRIQAHSTGRHAEISKRIAQIDNNIGLLGEYRSLLRALNIGEAMENAALDPKGLLSMIDTGPRQNAFYLALHYWEGIFLETSPEWDSSWPGGNIAKKYSKESFLKKMAMVTPCIVATVYKAAGLFDYFNGKSQPLEESIDLLIFDEAGQIGPEMGLPLLGLAKSAVIVGDDKQLAPIGTNEMTDIVRLKHNAISEDNVAWLDKRGLIHRKDPHEV